MRIAIRGARVLDGCGRTYERATVLISGERIDAVEPEGRGTRRRGTQVIDGRGLTLLPGLIDCHVHLGLGAEADVVRAVCEEAPGLTLLKAARFAQATLDAGFTTVRDLGFRDHGIFALKQAIDAGLVPGPRIVAAGLVICMTGGHASFIGRQADGPVEVVTAVRDQIRAGAGVIKFIASGGVLSPGTSPEHPQFTPEELTAGMTEARQAGRRVAAHAHGAVGMKQAVLAGAHSIEHGTLLDEEAADLMRTHGVVLVPTLSALATTADAAPRCGVPALVVEKARAMRARHERSFKYAHRTGLTIALGTDAGTPFNPHGENAQELERMVALGLSPLEAITAATRTAAELLGLADQLGTIERGKLADLVLVEGNPLKRIAVLRHPARIVGVMKGGRFVAGPLAH